MSANLGFQNKLQMKAMQNFQDHIESMQTMKTTGKAKDANFFKLLELDKFGQQQGNQKHPHFYKNNTFKR